MGSEPAGIVDGSSLERLTLAIRRGFANIEKSLPGVFLYDNIMLRGALERRVYQEATLDPARLAGLARASGESGLFSEWLPHEKPGAGLRNVREYVKAALRMIGRGYFCRVGRDVNPGPEFVFHVLRPRFVDFFLPIIERLGTNRCAVLCEPGYAVEEAAARHGLKVIERKPARLRLAATSHPPKAVFPFYSIAVISFLNALGTLQRCQPRAVVFAEAASFPEEIVARAAGALKIATIRVQYGRAGLLSSGYYDMPYDKMLMWGDGFVERLRRTSPDCEYIVTGSSLMDKFAGSPLRSDHELFTDDRPVVTVISQPECVNITRQDYETLVAIVDRVLQENEDVRVLVRLHPADEALDFDHLTGRWPGRLRVTAAEDFPLDVVIGGSALVVGLYSTVLSEAAAAGVLPVVLRLGVRHRVFPCPEEEGAAVLVTETEEAVAAIGTLASDASARKRYDEGMKAFARKYFGPMDGGAIERIAGNIEAAAFCAAPVNAVCLPTTSETGRA